MVLWGLLDKTWIAHLPKEGEIDIHGKIDIFHGEIDVFHGFKVK